MHVPPTHRHRPSGSPRRNGYRATDVKQRTLTAPGPVDLRLILGSAWWTTNSPAGPATLHLEQHGDTIEATAWGDGAAWALDQAPDLLGFHDRPEEFAPHHEMLRDLHRRLRGLRIGRTDRVFEATVPLILGQKISSREAHRNLRDLTGRLGQPAPGPGDLKLPVTPETLATVPYWDLHELGIERHRAELLRFLAKRAGRLEEITTMSRADAYQRLTAFRGIGPWTAAGVMAAALGDTDAVPVGDYHLPNTVAWALAGEPRGDDARMLELLEPYRGQRGRVIRLLKTAHVHAPRYGPRSPTRAIHRI